MEPIIVPSARRHGISDEAMLHAFRNFVRAEGLDDGVTMLTGPDHAGNLIEVGVRDSDAGTLIIHAMPAREQFLP